MAFNQISTKFNISGDSSAYWEVQTDFTTRPIKLLLDTGAEVTLIAIDVLLSLQLGNFRISLTGVTGPEHAITTHGNFMGSLITENNIKWPTEIHAVDRKYAGQYDGYLGFDFMMAYGAIIDFRNRRLILHSGVGNEIEVNEENMHMMPLPTNYQPIESAHSDIESNLDASLEEDVIAGNNTPHFHSQSSMMINSPNENANYGQNLQVVPYLNQDLNITAQTNPFVEDCYSKQKDLGKNDELHSKVKETEIIVKNKPLAKQSTPNELINLEKWPINDLNDYKALLNDINSKTFLNTDDEVTKLKKIMSYKMRMNDEATKYVKFFGAKKIHVSKNSKNPEKFLIKMSKQATRKELIFQNLKLAHANEQEKAAVKKLVDEFQMQFYIEGDKLAKANVISHKIHLKPGTGIINVRQFRLPETTKIKISNATQKLYDDHIIRKSDSPFNFPTFMVPKKDEHGNLLDDRQVFDYRRLNAATIPQNFPIPLIQELVDSFTQAKYISKLDIERAFNQIPMEEEHKPYTAFTVGYNKFEFNGMPFGLANAPATMQKNITMILSDLLTKGVSVYMDDIAIHTKTFEEHVELLNEIFTRLKRHGIQLKIKKCEFFTKQIGYLGFLISPGKVAPNPIKTKVISNYPIPRTRKQLQSFLGMCNYFRQFIKDYAKITRPLTKLTSSNVNYELNPEAITAFEVMKRVMAEQVTLSIVDFSKEFSLSTDASNIAIGAVLTQKQDKGERPIYFFSRTLNEHEVNYPTHEKELLAIVAAIEEFETYLKGRKFVVKTDSQCLVYLFSDPHKNKRLVRQAINILDANFDVHYQPGKLNVVADALSRIEYSDPEQWDQVPVSEFIKRHVDIKKTIKRIMRQRAIAFSAPNTIMKIAAHVSIKNGKPKSRYHQQLYTITSSENKTEIAKLIDPSRIKDSLRIYKISDLHSLITIKPTETGQNEIQSIVNAIKNHSSQNDFKNIAIETDFKARSLFILKHSLHTTFDQTKITVNIHINQIIELTTTQDIQNALEMHHNLRLGGHAGINRMKSTMKQIYFWPTMNSDIKKHVAECPICEKAKITRYTKMPMQITSSGSRPFEHVYLDHVGPISPPSDGGFNNIFVATCDLTRFSIAVPVSNLETETTADVFIRHVILQFGFPEIVSHDGGKAFKSEIFFQVVNKLLKAKDITTTPYNPRANMVERRNRSTAEYLKCYTQLKPSSWAELLPYATFAYNITINSATGFSPFELVFGRKVTLPDALAKQKPIYNYDNYAELIKREFADAWQLAKEKLATIKEMNKKHYDKDVKLIDIKIGDKILVKKIVKNRKFDFAWNGPFPVTKVFEKYIEYKDGRKTKKISKDYVKLAKAIHNFQFAQRLSEQHEIFTRQIYLIKRTLQEV